MTATAEITQRESFGSRFMAALRKPSGIFLALLAAYVLFTRLWMLDLKPIQHDESMFAYYSFLAFRGDNYVYMPILHGPVLEWATALVFTLFGDSEYTMRIFPALCGIGVLLTVYLMRERMGLRATYIALLLLAISPTVTFFSRYNRSDIVFNDAALLIVFAGWQYSRKHKPAWLIVLLVLLAYAVSIMETYVVFFFLLGTFGLGCWIHGFAKKKPYNEIPLYGEVCHSVFRHWWAIAVGLALGLLLIVTLFTSFFTHMEHKNGVGEAITYWSGQNKEHRIRGEFHFHLIRMAIYELPFLLYFVYSVVMQMWPRDPSPSRLWRRGLFFVWLAGSIIILNWPSHQPTSPGATSMRPLWRYEFPESFFDLTHLRLGLHIWMFLQICLVIGITGWNHLNHGRTFHAFVDYWTAGSFLAYSYAGEKVPWVGLHIVIPMLISCGMYADAGIRKWLGEETPAKTASEEPPREAPRAAPAARKWKGRSIKRQPDKAKKKPAAPIPARERKPTRWPTGVRLYSRIPWMIFVAAGLSWEIWLAYFVPFRNSGSPIEFYTYASSHTEFKKMFDDFMRDRRAEQQSETHQREIELRLKDAKDAHQKEVAQLNATSGKSKAEIAKLVKDSEHRYKKEVDDIKHGFDTPVAFAGEPSWPLTWSLRRFRNQITGSIPPDSKSQYVFIDNNVYNGISYNPTKASWDQGPIPVYRDRYDWGHVRFRHYWQPIPLDWKNMKRVGLLLKDRTKLPQADQQAATACHDNWLRLWDSMVNRDEDAKPPRRWDYIGGYDAYIGKIKETAQPNPTPIPDSRRSAPTIQNVTPATPR